MTDALGFAFGPPTLVAQDGGGRTWLLGAMWAGGRFTFLAPVPIGSRVRKTSSILKVEHKVGEFQYN